MPSIPGAPNPSPGLQFFPQSVSGPGAILMAWEDSDSLTLIENPAEAVNQSQSQPILLTETGVVLASWVDAEAFGLTDLGYLLVPIRILEGVVTIALDGPSDSLTLSDAGLITAQAVTANDSVALSETGVVAAAGNDIVDLDSVALSEIESLLASLDAPESIIVGEASLLDTGGPPVPEPEIRVVTAPLAFLEPERDTDEDEVAVLAAYVGWYH